MSLHMHAVFGEIVGKRRQTDFYREIQLKLSNENRLVWRQFDAYHSLSVHDKFDHVFMLNNVNFQICPSLLGYISEEVNFYLYYFIIVYTKNNLSLKYIKIITYNVVSIE